MAEELSFKQTNRRENGEFGETASCAQDIKRVIQAYPNWQKLSVIQREALDLMAHDLARILVGDPSYRDHWQSAAAWLLRAVDPSVIGLGQFKRTASLQSLASIPSEPPAEVASGG